MSREREDIYRQLAHIYRDLADSLSSISMEGHATGATNCADRGDILHHSDLIIREHDRNEAGVRAHGRPHGCWIDASRSVRGQVSDREALFFEPLARVEHRLVLGS